jgi:capsular exopolysaccharide synthesis family protein
MNGFIKAVLLSLEHGRQVCSRMLKFPFRLFPRKPVVALDVDHASALGLPVLAAIGGYETEPDSTLPNEDFPEALDAYRRLVDQIRAPEFHVHGRVIVVTSAENGGGKSDLALNLATLLARGGSKVVLVDGDLRQASRRKLGDGSTSSGLSGLLVNQLRTASSAVVHTLEPKLKLLPVGSVTSEPAVLLRSPRLPLVFDQLRSLADHVIFDTPSVVEWADMQLLMRLADLTILRVEPGKTGRNAAQDTVAILKEANRGTLGLVLERVHGTVSAIVPRDEPTAVTTAPQAALTPEPPQPAEKRLELAVDELLADLESALTLIRSIRQTSSHPAAPKPPGDTELAAIE